MHTGQRSHVPTHGAFGGTCYRALDFRRRWLDWEAGPAVSPAAANEPPRSLCSGDSEELSPAANEDFFTMDEGAGGTSLHTGENSFVRWWKSSNSFFSSLGINHLTSNVVCFLEHTNVKDGNED